MAKKESKSKILKFRLTPTEAEKVFKCARESGMDLPDYLRRVMMRGITFRVEENIPDTLIVESTRLERIENADALLKRKHVSG